jgi:hypothetical protein
MADEQWYYAQSGQQRGPFPRLEILARAQRGEISPQDHVWTDGMPQWLPACQVPGLFEVKSPPPLPPMQSIPFASAAPPMYAPPQDLGQSAGMRMLLPVGRSGWAIAAGYLGLFSFLILPAPIALIFSIVAIRDIKQHPESHGLGRAVFGLIMGIGGSVVLIFAVIALVAGR